MSLRPSPYVSERKGNPWLAYLVDIKTGVDPCSGCQDVVPEVAAVYVAVHVWWGRKGAFGREDQVLVEVRRVVARVCTLVDVRQERCIQINERSPEIDEGHCWDLLLNGIG